MTTQKIRILLCDDHEVVREGLRGLIARQEGMSVVGEAGTMAEGNLRRRGRPAGASLAA